MEKLCALSIAIPNLTPGEEPTFKDYVHLHIQAQKETEEFEQKKQVRLVLQSMSDVEWYKKTIAVVFFTYLVRPLSPPE